MDPDAPTNLWYICIYKPNQTCAHAQDMAGGEWGQLNFNHPTSSTLPLSPATLLLGRLAAKAQYGYLYLPGDELGAHFPEAGCLPLLINN